MTFILGIIVGILLVYVSAFLYSQARHSVKIKDIAREVKEKTGLQEKTEFIAPLTPEGEAIADIIEDNEAKGRDTLLEELG